MRDADSELLSTHRRLDQEQVVTEGSAVDAVDGDVREAERLLQDAERHV